MYLGCDGVAHGVLDESYCCADDRSIPVAFDVQDAKQIASLALVLSTDEVDRVFLWVVYRISPHVIGLPEGVPPAASFGGGMLHGLNVLDRIGYVAPCRKRFGEVGYRLELYGLDNKLEDAPPGWNAEQLLAHIDGHVVANATLNFRI